MTAKRNVSHSVVAISLLVGVFGGLWVVGIGFAPPIFAQVAPMTTKAATLAARPDRIEIPLRDAGGVVRILLLVSAGNGGQGGEVQFLDPNRKVLATLDGSKERLPQLALAPSSDRKADAAKPEDIAYLQGQIDIIRKSLNEAIARVNTLSK